MSLTDAIVAAGSSYPEPFKRGKDGTLELETVVAERKAFLSKRKLTYRCRLRVDDQARRVRFFEILVEKGSGISSGEGDMAAGFGFKKETYKVGGATREGTIEEQSRLFGKDYDYRFEFGAVRKDAERAAAEAGYAFEVVLREKSL
jgi:hypothetical protein